MVFGLPNIWEGYSHSIVKKAIPYLLPLLQTFLTISVYATIAIAISGALAVRSSSNNGTDFHQKLTLWIHERGMNGTALAITTVVILSTIFNTSRWFEIEAVTSAEEASDDNRTVTKTILKVLLHAMLSR